MLTLAPSRPGTRSFHDSRFPQARYNGRSNFKCRDEWRTWVELSVKVYQLPTKCTTKSLFDGFSREGHITTIDIFEDNRGSQEGVARIRFSPPPERPFWNEPAPKLKDVPIRIELETPRRSFLHPSPVNPSVRYPEKLVLVPKILDFGCMLKETTFINMKTLTAVAKESPIGFILNLLKREIDVYFVLSIDHPEPLGRLRHTYRFKIPLAQVEHIFETRNPEGQRALLIPLDNPPSFYRKVHDIGYTHSEEATHWNERMAWYRQTDIASDRNAIKRQPVTLKKAEPIIDIGRWTTYRLVFDMGDKNRHRYDVVIRALRDYNIKIRQLDGLEIIRETMPPVWDWIDRKPKTTAESLRFDLDFEELTDENPHLEFAVRYQLEVCMSQGYLNEYNLDKQFVDTLAALEQGYAKDLLERVAETKRRFFDPMEIFKLTAPHASSLRKIPRYCAYAWSATVTPSTILFNTLVVETSNRVIRQYSEHNNRFLRVRFTDEKFRGRIHSQDEAGENEVFTRIKRAMVNGIGIGDRHYEFLAFGNSQLREHGAYFFAPTETLGATDIRRWMGEFDHIKVVAKYASRLGQCFSTTRAIHGTKVQIVKLKDVKRGGYNFTDGVGKISSFLAKLISAEFGLPPTDAPPSLFQFRLGGCKGVLAVSPDAKNFEIHVRPSQEKFGAVHQGLEIIRVSAFATASLNRQIILILSTLGVGDQIFVSKLRRMLGDLEHAMSDESLTLKMLQRYVDFNHMTLMLASIISDGFMNSNEPFVMSLLHLWRAWNIKYLKEHAKICIEEGAFLLGCVDETASLRGHFTNREVPPTASEEDHIDSLPEIFVQISISRNRADCRVVTGLCLLARNPSLHPGDIRMVKAVDVPALRHLRDVVVLPQTGDRDVANMCSGGDLDGDDYLVIWDKELFPPSWNWNHAPMDYTPPTAIEVSGTVTTDNITTFFVNYMKNDKLPSIAIAHMGFADRSEDGVKDSRCLRLAQLHSLAVDYAKTGVPAKLPRDLRPNQWPHWMEKIHLPKERQYHSGKVLGQLFDQVERVDFTPDYAAAFDKRILEAYQLSEEMLSVAADLKGQYDAAMHATMAQHDIRTEHEVWSTFVMHHAKITSDYKFHEEVGRISAALKERFQTLCYEKSGGREFEKLGPFVAAMYMVTQRQVKAALEKSFETRSLSAGEIGVKRENAKSMPLISFAWLFPKVLGKIATGRTDVSGYEGVSKPTARRRAQSLQKAFDGLFRDVGDVETDRGVTHQGELLELFPHDEGAEGRMTHEARVDAGIEGSGPGTEARPLNDAKQYKSWQIDPEEEVHPPTDLSLLDDEAQEVSDRDEDHKLFPSTLDFELLDTLTDTPQFTDAALSSQRVPTAGVEVHEQHGGVARAPSPVGLDFESIFATTYDQVHLPLSNSKQETFDKTSGNEVKGENAEEEDIQIDFGKQASALDELEKLLG